MERSLRIELQGHDFELYPEKAMLHLDSSTLIITDLHLGKASHFRKSGIAVPMQASVRTIDDLEQIVAKALPERLVILGDLFHSEYNNEWRIFGEFLDRFNGLPCTLVKGNHDILEPQVYANAGISVVDEMSLDDAFVMVHDPKDAAKDDQRYALTGHIHPGVLLRGRGRQHMRLPCYFFGEKYGVLPAFGRFTGLYILEPDPIDQVYTVVGDAVIKIQ